MKGTTMKRPPEVGPRELKKAKLELPDGFTETHEGDKHTLVYNGVAIVKVNEDDLATFVVGIDYKTRKEAELKLGGRSLPGYCMDWVCKVTGDRDVMVDDMWVGHNGTTSEELIANLPKKLPSMSTRFLEPGADAAKIKAYKTRVANGCYY